MALPDTDSPPPIHRNATSSTTAALQVASSSVHLAPPPLAPALHDVPGNAESIKTLNELLAGLKHLDLTKNVWLGQRKACGGFADIYNGQCYDTWTDQTRTVAVKQFRVWADSNKDFAQVCVLMCHPDRAVINEV